MSKFQHRHRTVQDTRDDNVFRRRELWCWFTSVVSELRLPAHLFIELSGVDDKSQNETGNWSSRVFKSNYAGQVVVGKRIRAFPFLATSPTKFRRFLTQYQKWRALDHPNVFPMLGLDLTDPVYPILVMPCSINIRQFVARRWPSSYPEAAVLDKWLLGVCSGLRYLHENSIHHQRLCGNNIMMSDKGVPQLTDFDFDSFRNVKLFPQFRALDNYNRWRAPELLRLHLGLDKSQLSTSAKSDVYSFACVCVELYTNDIPFPSSTNQEVWQYVTHEGRRPNHSTVATFCVQMAPAMWDLVNICLDFTPTKRPTSSELHKRLERIIQDYTVVNIVTRDKTSTSRSCLQHESSDTPGTLDIAGRPSCGQSLHSTTANISASKASTCPCTRSCSCGPNTLSPMDSFVWPQPPDRPHSR